MVPIQDDPVPEGQAPDPAATHECRADPVRTAVHIMLALYLMPVLLVVCLIGGISVLIGGVARFASRLVGNRWYGDKGYTPIAGGRAKIGEIGGRGRADRNRSRVAR
jgi:hypothetical protein